MCSIKSVLQISGSSLLLVVLAFSTLEVEAKAEPVSKLSTAQTARVEAAVQEKMAEAGIPGMSVALAVGNELVFSKGFGLADVENNVPATERTMYRTASIAKSMTAVAVMRLVEQGAIDLDAPVQRYCPKFPEKQWPITIRQLLNHTSGIRHYKKNSRESTSTRHYENSADALEVFADDPLGFEPGTDYLYSTYGYNLLGLVIEAAAGEDYFSCLQKAVLTPAEMTSTVVDHHFRIIPGRTRGYMRLNDNTRGKLPAELLAAANADGIANAPLHDTSMKIPAGGLLATAPDLVRFAIALNTGMLLEEDTLEQIWTRQKLKSGKRTQYGLGFRVSEMDGKKVVGHSGGQAGTSTYFLLCPDARTSVAVACNLQGAELLPLSTELLASITLRPDEVGTTSQ